MWRKVDGGQDPNTYLVIDKVVMKKGMSVEVVHDEDIDSKISDGNCWSIILSTCNYLLNYMCSFTMQQQLCHSFLYIFTESGRSHRGSTLIIPLAQGEDQGQYVCIVAAHPNKEIKHTVQIRGNIKNAFYFKHRPFTLYFVCYLIYIS